MQTQAQPGGLAPFAKRITRIRLAVAGFALTLLAGLVSYALVDRAAIENATGERLELLANVMAENIQTQLGQIEHQLLGAKRVVMAGDSGAIGGEIARDLLNRTAQLAG